MALSTFSELKTEIANYVDRSDLTDQIPTFIKLAEARINRLLRVRIMETVKIISLISGVKRYPLPSDYLQLRTIQYDASSVADTTLSAEINDSVDSIALTSATGFTSTGTVLIGTEQITYTGISTDTLTGCTRGTAAPSYGKTPISTTAGSHSSGAKIYGSYIITIVETSFTNDANSVETYSNSFTCTLVNAATGTAIGGGTAAICR